MVFRLPRRLKLGCERPFGRGGNLVALAGLGALLASAAQAQVIIGGRSGPAVSVDNGVLERLGPPLTLPQFFLGGRNPGTVNRQVATNQRTTHSAATSHRKAKRHIATRSKHPTSHKVAVAKAAPPRTVKAPVQTAAASSSSLNQIIHLIPPTSRVASAAPTPPAEASYQQVTHQEVAISAPTKPAVVALAAPAPLPAPAPKQPASNDIPTPALAPPQQARVEPPATPVAPPSQPVAAATPPAAALVPTVTANAVPTATPSAASTPAPSSLLSAAPPAVSPMTVAVATPTPTTSVTTAPPAVAPPPVQMAAATTVGSPATALKFKPGVADLGNGGQPVLDTIASKLLANESLRVQLVSHATGGPDDAMEARRVSLARAVAVRAYLIDKGVRSLRIDVRALGNRTDTGPAADQVDLLVVSQ